LLNAGRGDARTHAPDPETFPSTSEGRADNGVPPQLSCERFWAGAPMGRSTFECGSASLTASPGGEFDAY